MGLWPATDPESSADYLSPTTSGLPDGLGFRDIFHQARYLTKNYPLASTRNPKNVDTTSARRWQEARPVVTYRTLAREPALLASLHADAGQIGSPPPSDAILQVFSL